MKRKKKKKWGRAAADLGRVRANCEEVAAAPGQGGDDVPWAGRLDELVGRAGRGVPEEDALPERDGEDVVGRPVEEVEVVVVDDVGRVEDLVGALGNEPRVPPLPRARGGRGAARGADERQRAADAVGAPAPWRGEREAPVGRGGATTSAKSVTA